MSGEATQGEGGPGEKVSALVPAWNAAATIGRCIGAILAQEPAVLEVLVADDGSDDGTAERAAAAGARVLDLGGRRGICAGRNRLLREARGDLVWFVDSDSLAEPGCLARLLAARRAHPEAGLVHGPNLLPPGYATIANTAYAVLGRHHFLATTRARWTNHVTTANCLMSRRLALETGLFRHFRSGEKVYDYYEDLDLALRAAEGGARCWFEPAAITLHENPRGSVGAFLRHRVKCGVCATLVRRRHPRSASFGRLYAGSPWLFLPLAPAVALYSACKALLVHLRHREMPPRRVLAAAPLVLLGQVFYAAGAVRGAFLDHRGKVTEEVP